jgi:hypothetical protein
VDLPQVAPLLAPFAERGLDPGRQLVGKVVELAWTLPVGIPGVDFPVAQVFAEGVAGQARAPGFLPNRHPVSQAPPPDHTQ